MAGGDVKSGDKSAPLNQAAAGKAGSAASGGANGGAAPKANGSSASPAAVADPKPAEPSGAADEDFSGIPSGTWPGCKSAAYVLGENKKAFSEDEIAFVRRAYDTSARLHAKQKRKTGEPYFIHCVAVARKTGEICPEPGAIAAALLHDTLEDTPYTHAKMSADFGQSIADVVEGVTKLRHVSDEASQTPAAETLRKMMIAGSRDARVLIVKLCDRLHNMATLKAMREEKRQRIAAETLELYAPLAHMLGMSRARSELEDLSMLHLYPKEYEDIAEKVAKKSHQREKLVESLLGFLQKIMAQNGVEGRALGRSKHIYGIWEKMRRQKVDFDQIYDLIALRAIVPTVGDCYKLLGVVHAWFAPIHGRFRDYISQPKANGYQSLHTTINGPHGGRVEIQIRTEKMDQMAEEGIAAHWRYKYKAGAPGAFDLNDFDHRLLERLRHTVETLKDVESRDVAETLRTDLFSETVVIYTPRGQSFDLPEGSTPIDFAYRVHSEVGNRCAGAKVDGRMIPLTRELENGQTVEIVTGKKAHPTRDWLEHVKTHKARVRIRQWLKQENYDDNIDAGRSMIIQAFKGAELGIPASEVEKALEPIVHNSGKYASVEALFATVGFGSLKASSVADRVKQARAKQKRKAQYAPVLKPEANVLVDGNEGMVARMAQCCRPIEGEPILGFVRRGHGVVVHCKSCRTLERLTKKPGARQRLVRCDWRPGTPGRSRSSLRVYARDRSGLLADVTQILKEESIFIIDYGLSNRDAGSVTLRFDVATEDAESLKPALKRLREAESVLDISVV